MNIEPTRSGLLTRDDITSILNERHLKIPNIELMGYDELLRIYETFAQPLEKRFSRRFPENVVNQEPPQPAWDVSCTKLPFNEDFQVHRVLSDKSHDIFDSPPTKYIKLSFNTMPSAAKKRPNGITVNGAQEATQAKRKPITWP